MEKANDIMTLQEAANLMGMNIKLMSRYLRNGTFPGVKIGRAWRIVRKDLIQAVSDLSRKGKQVPGAFKRDEGGNE